MYADINKNFPRLLVIRDSLISSARQDPMATDAKFFKEMEPLTAPQRNWLLAGYFARADEKVNPDKQEQMAAITFKMISESSPELSQLGLSALVPSDPTDETLRWIPSFVSVAQVAAAIGAYWTLVHDRLPPFCKATAMPRITFKALSVRCLSGSCTIPLNCLNGTGIQNARKMAKAINIRTPPREIPAYALCVTPNSIQLKPPQLAPCHVFPDNQVGPESLTFDKCKEENCQAITKHGAYCPNHKCIVATCNRPRLPADFVPYKTEIPLEYCHYCMIRRSGGRCKEKECEKLRIEDSLFCPEHGPFYIEDDEEFRLLKILNRPLIEKYNKDNQ